jgi:hypothetical protein
MSLYLTQAMLDATLPATKVKICERLSLPASTLHDYRAHELIAPLLVQWSALKRARVAMRYAVPGRQPKAATVLEVRNDERESVDEVVLASDYDVFRRRAIATMQQFVFHHRKSVDVADLALCARDLGRALQTLSGIQGELQSLADRWVIFAGGRLRL